MADTTTQPRNNRKRRREIIKWVKRGVAIAVALGLVVAVVIAVMPKPVPVDIAPATRGPLKVTVREDGKTRVENRYQVSAPLTGNMPRLGLLEGDPVEIGTVVARIAPATPPLLDARTRAEAEARLAAALAGQRQVQAQVNRARAAHDHAAREAARVESLVGGGAVSQQDRDAAVFQERSTAQELTAAEFGARVAAQDVASARAALGILESRGKDQPALEIPSPVSGQVLRVLRKDEGLIAAGTPIVEIGDVSSLEVVADVLTRDAVHIRPGAAVSIVRWGGDEALTGQVHRVEPSAFTRISALGVEEQRVNVIIDFDGPQEQRATLGDGFRVEVQIVVWSDDAVLTVPASSVFRHGDSWAVFAVVDDIAELTSVEVGRRNEVRVQILDGLADGARVVLHPSDQIQDGVKVVQREEL